MLTQKVDRKKIFQYSAVLGVIFLIIIYIILTNFVFKPNANSTSGTSSQGKDLTNNIVKDIKPLDVKIIETDKFKSLKENVLNQVKIEDLRIGKKDPFSPGSSGLLATSTPISSTPK